MKGVKDWLVNEIQILGVDVRLNTIVEPDDITDEAPDVVIIATGGGRGTASTRRRARHELLGYLKRRGTRFR